MADQHRSSSREGKVLLSCWIPEEIFALDRAAQAET
jgi:hypothetical protein